MKDLIDIINAKDEITQLEYKISKLEMLESDFVEEEEFEKAQLVLIEQKRIKRRIKYLNDKINDA